MTRRALDFYATPEGAIRSLLSVVALPGRIRILDPAAGDGSLLRAVGGGVGLEIDPARAAASGAECRDALAPGKWPACDLVIMNPPFSHALEFVTRALAENPGGVIALLRLGFMAGKKRAAFHAANPSDVIVLSKRPSFTADGKTDASEYAWFCWPGVGKWSVAP